MQKKDRLRKQGAAFWDLFFSLGLLGTKTYFYKHFAKLAGSIHPVLLGEKDIFFSQIHISKRNEMEKFCAFNGHNLITPSPRALSDVLS